MIQIILCTFLLPYLIILIYFNNTKHIKLIAYMQGTVYLVHITALRKVYMSSYFHYTNEKMEAQKGYLSPK